MPRYQAVLRDGGERSAEYDSGPAFVVAGDEIEVEGDVWRVEGVEAEGKPERLICVPAPDKA
jgi:hypothetical protein